MHIWNTKALAHELAQNALTQRQYKNYYLGTALLISALYYYAMYSPYYNPAVILFEGVLTIIIMLFGINRAYQINGAEQGEFFIQRITALSFPIMLQTSVAGIIFALLLLNIFDIFNLSIFWLDVWYEWCVSAFTVLLQVIFFVRLSKYMHRVAQHQI
ncbi:hypothetical protein F4V57_06035 [Acinetobacter qingfengensis]|uniref:Uncharacterized protein n=1 Tax=Acinetobacter qingfengensis TaxID=1262585 RepID=A0A1E7RE75_9GAMM|nr:hypothetical protein [Acinetobacter qingfengensis]KAA8734515.1 hypothetical protein F4V57_06035 [Acinetobacter qingfengensis]OEY97552.1 hypothetical protein BJI46_09365 [Acinetobacter qingfengensis]